MSLITIFADSGDENGRAKKNRAGNEPQSEWLREIGQYHDGEGDIRGRALGGSKHSSAYYQALATVFIRWGVRVIGLEPDGRVVLQVPEVNHDRKLDLLACELGMKRIRWVCRADPL